MSTTSTALSNTVWSSLGLVDVDVLSFSLPLQLPDPHAGESRSLAPTMPNLTQDTNVSLHPGFLYSTLLLDCWVRLISAF